MIRVEFWLTCDGCGTGLYSSERTKTDALAAARNLGYTVKGNGYALCSRCAQTEKDEANRAKYRAAIQPALVPPTPSAE